MELNPLPPDDYYWIKASAQFMRGHPADALKTLENVRNERPVLRIKAACHGILGNREEASRCRREFLLEYPDFRAANWSSVIPITRHEDVERFVDGLRAAGFP